MRGVLAATLIALAGPSLASDFSLAFPVDCELGETCYIQQFVDRDPGPRARDFTCGSLSYDGHKGTDFALPTLAAMDAGVDVLAAAPGTVRGTRDGMRDVLYSDETAAEVEDRECGNGVAIDHGNGWVTQYCHLKQGTIAVRTGDIVQTGDRLGQVGLSGKTQFPHIHLSVRKDGERVDPFGSADVASCGLPAMGDDTLWDPPLPYRPGGLLDVGFAESIPGYDNVKAGTADAPIRPDSPAIVLFALAFGSQAGDQLILQATGPDGEVFSQTVDLERTQAQFYRATGRRLRATLTPGTYVGTVVMQRNGRVIDSTEVSIDVN